MFNKRNKSTHKGLTYLFTGNGKGKTSAALGMTLRATCMGKKVAWVSWYKSENWDISEKKISQLLPTVSFFLMGEGFYIKSENNQANEKQIKVKSLKTGGKVIDSVSADEHRHAALTALKKVKQLLESKQYFLLICDEVCNAVYDGLLSAGEVLEVISKRQETHLVLTGRNASKELIAVADLVSDIRKVKHPYDEGTPAVKGLDF